ncbi:hypothetical protein F5X96DRAFT_675111 [Biscogniauxia mediterranea]|nr:hypothetical protein F5X96DRAFT_675111 [Biscogniauxia mediterranea]
MTGMYRIGVDVDGTNTDAAILDITALDSPGRGVVAAPASDEGTTKAKEPPQVLAVDIGGTTTDVCALLPSGFPRQAPGFVEVSVDAETGGAVTMGPGSVGHCLTSSAFVFGGSTLTITDVVVASGDAKLGDRARTAGVPAQVIRDARAQIKKMLEGVVERMKGELEGVVEGTRPVHHGAAKVSGEVDMIAVLEGGRREDRACGGVPASDRGGGYVTNKATRIQVRAVGKLATPDHIEPQDTKSKAVGDVDDDAGDDEPEGENVQVSDALEPTSKPSLKVDLETYRPDVRDGVWYLSEVDVEMIATLVRALLLLRCLEVLRTGGVGKMRVVRPKSVKDTDLVCFGSWYGAPSVINERVAGGREIIDGIDTVNRIMGNDRFDAMFTDEIGGGNGLSAFPTGVHYHVPVIDGDAMGRAYPTMYHATLYIYGNPITPCAISNAKGNTSVIMNTESPFRTESMMRTTAIELGLGCAVYTTPLRGDAIKKWGVPNTISQAWYIGRAVHLARKLKTNFVDAIRRPPPLHRQGDRRAPRHQEGLGYTMGSVLLAPLSDEERGPGDDDGDNSAEGGAAHDHPVPERVPVRGMAAKGRRRSTCGMGCARVSVIGLPSHPLWKTPQGLKVGGPGGLRAGGDSVPRRGRVYGSEERY